MDKGLKKAECDMRCQWAYLPVWAWCITDCVCVCKGVNHSKYVFWANPENIKLHGKDRITGKENMIKCENEAYLTAHNG